VSEKFSSIEDAFAALAKPGSPEWAEAFSFLARHPDSAALMLQTFRETLEQMGVEPSGTDPITGEPGYSLAHVARAMGSPEDDLDLAVNEIGEGNRGLG
jgi:hypothetical protein